MKYILNKGMVGINGIEKISLKEIIEKFLYPKNIKIKIEKDPYNINIELKYEDFTVYYNIYYYVEKDYDKSTIYHDLVYSLLVEWYRDNRIMFKEWNASIDIEIYILIDDELIKNKDINFNNELIIATESDRNDVRQQYKNYDKTKIRFFDYDEIKDLPNIFLDNKRGSEAERFIFFYQLEKIKADNSKQLKVEISNSMKIFHVLNIYLLVYIIDKILIEKFIEGKEIKMFMIFANELAE